MMQKAGPRDRPFLLAASLKLELTIHFGPVI
jgi:hypothetical protein